MRTKFLDILETFSTDVLYEYFDMDEYNAKIFHFRTKVFDSYMVFNKQDRVISFYDEIYLRDSPYDENDYCFAVCKNGEYIFMDKNGEFLSDWMQMTFYEGHYVIGI